MADLVVAVGLVWNQERQCYAAPGDATILLP